MIMIVIESYYDDIIICTIENLLFENLYKYLCFCYDKYKNIKFSDIIKEIKRLIDGWIPFLF